MPQLLLRAGSMTFRPVDHAGPSRFADSHVSFKNPSPKTIVGNAGVVRARPVDRISRESGIRNPPLASNLVNPVLITRPRFVLTSSARPERRRLLANTIPVRVSHKTGSARGSYVGRGCGLIKDSPRALVAAALNHSGSREQLVKLSPVRFLQNAEGQDHLASALA